LVVSFSWILSVGLVVPFTLVLLFRELAAPEEQVEDRIERNLSMILVIIISCDRQKL
jgi:hypothetical protein